MVLVVRPDERSRVVLNIYPRRHELFKSSRVVTTG